jgi:hypothetical protein
MWLMTVEAWMASGVTLVKGSNPVNVLSQKTECYLARGRLDEGLPAIRPQRYPRDRHGH